MSALSDAFEKHKMPGWIRGIDELVKLTDNIKAQREADLSDINTDKMLSYGLIEGNINTLTRILKESVYKNTDMHIDKIDNTIKNIVDCDYSNIDSTNLKALLNPVMVHSLLGDALEKIPAFISFTKEYLLFTDNLKTSLGLLKYKDNSLAKKIIQMISIKPTIERWKTELDSILKSNMKDIFIKELDKESYKNIKASDHFNAMHPIIFYYGIMHEVIRDIAILEKDLKS